MRILQVHNYYQQPGGEDRVFADEGRLLEERGHTVFRYTAHNDAVRTMPPLRLARATIWNPETVQAVQRLIRAERPEILHAHNTLPLISPAVYYAARREGVAVVQTLHNYRLFCPGGLFARDGRVCEDCLGRRVAWPGVLHACYRGSRAATAAVTAMLSAHRLAGTWTSYINRYIALTEFARQKFIAGGLPAELIDVKPNFVQHTLKAGDGDGRYALFVGRLTHEKGVPTLLKSWQTHALPVPLKLIGDGPLASEVAAAAARHARIEWLGQKEPDAVYDAMRRAAVVIVPSEWYETFGRVVIEAFSVGTPVLASNLGAVAELVDHNRTGRLFRPGDADDLAAQILWMEAHPIEWKAMREQARQSYEARYTADRNYDLLMAIYGKTLRAIHP